MLISKHIPILCLVASTLILNACGNKEGEKVSKANTQVVAKVNGDEISIHQINFQLNRLTQQSQAQLTEAQNKEAAKQILKRLIDQQLLIQKAIEAKLDRNPNVLQALEASRNEILAQAYLEQLMAKAQKPSQAKIDAFYQENPELFEKRRVYRLQELVVNLDKEKHAEAEATIKGMKNINDIANWLKSKNYPFDANSNIRTAEQLPLPLLKKIQPLKDGEFVVVANEKSFNVIHIAASQSKPITREKATPIIEQFFMNQNKSALAKSELANLNKASKVKFLGAFAKMKDEVAPNLGNTATPSNSQESTTKEAVVQTPAKESVSSTNKGNLITPTTDAANMDRGLSGL